MSHEQDHSFLARAMPQLAGPQAVKHAPCRPARSRLRSTSQGRTNTSIREQHFPVNISQRKIKGKPTRKQNNVTSSCRHEFLGTRRTLHLQAVHFAWKESRRERAPSEGCNWEFAGGQTCCLHYSTTVLLKLRQTPGCSSSCFLCFGAI